MLAESNWTELMGVKPIPMKIEPVCVQINKTKQESHLAEKGRTSQPPSTPQKPYGLGEFQSLLLRKNLAEFPFRRHGFLVAEKARAGSPPSTPQTAYY
jgi:hypothetical protein